jgi:hypothetical protein
MTKSYQLNKYPQDGEDKAAAFKERERLFKIKEEA